MQGVSLQELLRPAGEDMREQHGRLVAAVPFDRLPANGRAVRARSLQAGERDPFSCSGSASVDGDLGFCAINNIFL